MRTDESTTTAGISDVVFQILKRVRHRHAALVKKLLKCRKVQPGETGGLGDRELSLTIKRDGEF